jgi:hypothetical protein
MTTAQESGPSTAGRPARIMKVGIAGLGVGAKGVIRAMENAPFLQITAAADVRPQALEATWEVILGLLQSSKEGKEIRMSHQVPAWE